ncbi:siderophore-interacting protein [Rhodoplanes sp. TEM]|uniref:Siderophore-interacting protein n=1 Tax=Rhodoplanes tepidamans TaxID=200616 RepID=A0ABT5J8V8_RHOTP|nr:MULTISPECIES: siderophore-interacting protein [Rhodoplanes]MDC7785734.1 siderophore-interacting protein [Rhodoplanes tepidamans]MDC7986300.1 siderophore-interacting protein [Rhodoplanes sp. TEM]MDQ0354704.1 NADPH-dependent ferric siderophore reductase [Rhodoplanes tepidamans]
MTAPSTPTAGPPARYRGIRILEVLRTETVTPQMRRLILGGEEIAGMRDDAMNIKILFAPEGVADPGWPLQGPNGKPVWPKDPLRPIVRTYTLRWLDAVRGELAVDFVLHADGEATRFARRAKPGDLVGVGGPGGRKVLPADWYLFAGDHTALPAIAHVLEKLPADAVGHALVEIPDAAEEQQLRKPDGIVLTWLHRDGLPPGRNTLLRDAVLALPWPAAAQRPFAWVCGESSTVRALRAYAREERKLDRRQIHAIGYWRAGLNENAYHDAYDNDRDEDYFKTWREELAERGIPAEAAD